MTTHLVVATEQFWQSLDQVAGNQAQEFERYDLLTIVQSLASEYVTFTSSAFMSGRPNLRLVYYAAGTTSTFPDRDVGIYCELVNGVIELDSFTTS